MGARGTSKYFGKFNVGDDPTTTTTVEGTDYFCGKIPSNTATPVVFTSIDTSNEVVGNIDKESGKLGCLVPTYISALPKDPTWAIGTNTLYTINALNYLITVLNDGKLDKQFPVPWQNYSNMVLVTNNGEFKKIKTRLLKIVELNG